MTKSDLKTGMYVRTQNKKIWLVVIIKGKPYLCYPSGWMPVESFPKAYKADRHYDIVEVYRGLHAETNNGAYLLQYDIFSKYIQTNNIAKALERIWTSESVKETIKIGDSTYDKQEFENAVKDLKPIK